MDAGSGNRTVAGMGAGYHDRRSRWNRRGQAHPEHSPDGRDDTATNDADGFRRAARLPRDGGAERAVMEATGRMHRGVARSPRDRGFAVVVVNPRQCRDLPGASGAPGRTDRAGAGVPAALSAAFPDMAATAPADAAVDRLRDMPVPRGAPVDRRAELGAVPGGVGEPEPDGPVRRVLEEPDAAVRGCDRRTGEPVRGSESLAERHRILTSVPGTGPVTAASPPPGRAGPARAATARPPPRSAWPPSPAAAGP